MRLLSLLILMAVTSHLTADTIFLKNGRKLEGGAYADEASGSATQAARSRSLATQYAIEKEIIRDENTFRYKDIKRIEREGKSETVRTTGELQVETAAERRAVAYEKACRQADEVFTQRSQAAVSDLKDIFPDTGRPRV